MSYVTLCFLVWTCPDVNAVNDSSTDFTLCFLSPYDQLYVTLALITHICVSSFRPHLWRLWSWNGVSLHFAPNHVTTSVWAPGIPVWESAKINAAIVANRNAGSSPSLVKGQWKRRKSALPRGVAVIGDAQERNAWIRTAKNAGPCSAVVGNANLYDNCWSDIVTERKERNDWIHSHLTIWSSCYLIQTSPESNTEPYSRFPAAYRQSS
jgi:hypothetical protein